MKKTIVTVAIIILSFIASALLEYWMISSPNYVQYPDREIPTW